MCRSSFVIPLLCILSICTPTQGETFELIRDDSSTQTSSDSVTVQNAVLFHTDQIVPDAQVTSSFQEQTKTVLKTLRKVIEHHELSTTNLVKLNVYLRDEQNISIFQQQLLTWCGKHLPAVAYVQTALPNANDLIGLDAVIAGESTVNPNSPLAVNVRALPRGDVVYVSGQAEPGDLPTATRATLESLLKTVQHFKLNREQVIALKCFLTPMSDVAVVKARIKEVFQDNPMPVVSYVEWVAGSSRPIEIEMIAAAPHTNAESTVTYFTPPGMKASPVFSRVARIHGNQRIYLSGFPSPAAGDAAEQTRAVYNRIELALKRAGSDLTHLAKATYYVSTSDASQQLNQLRPTYYDPLRPPAASKAMVTGVGYPDRQLSIDLIAAPSVAQ